MSALDGINIAILLGALLAMAGILSSLVALRFGAPLLLIFIVVGMLAGESGPGGIQFEDVRLAFMVGSIALALILFDGGLRTKFATFQNVLAPAGTLATLGVLITSGIVAPAAVYLFNLSWLEGLLMGAAVASTDAAAVFFLMHARGLRLRPRVAATIEVESGTNDPFAVFLTIVLVEILLQGQKPALEILLVLVREAALGTMIGVLGGIAIVATLNRVELPQGLHAPFVATGAIVTFGLCQSIHASGFLAVHLAGLIVGNRVMRARTAIGTFLDAATWLAQIAMFVLFGLLAWPERFPGQLLPAIGIAVVLMLVARPVGVFVSLLPYRFSVREKLFISWVGLRGAVGFFLASMPLLVGLKNSQVYFDVGFIVVIVSLLVQGWTIAPAARWLRIAKKRPDAFQARIELDLPGQRAQELVGYPVTSGSPYLRGGIIPSWAKIALVVRDEKVMTPEEARGLHEGDHVYLLAPQEKASSLDRFFANLPPPSSPDPELMGDFFIGGDTTLGSIAEIYGISVEPAQQLITVADLFGERLGRVPQSGDKQRLGEVVLVVHRVKDGQVLTVGLQLADEDEKPWAQRAMAWLRRLAR
ncbi:potassium/proton antiporter [Pseudorhodoplanes sp.]|uniref:potassium/proton antiporter n=1 Tax=Pseudorhodoplanes sp. TaxID=1934341 RepID=UPI002D1A5284|nr:potassium/proton antiporter [Pseudorhodoplanes sp.]HWV43792.1 potassium/proton antiporter [Pseudorhodoplanes sp.]